jgi:hypothetical protein
MGHVPVLVDKVGYTVLFPRQVSGTLTSYDFALRPIRSDSISGTNQIVQQGATPFMDELEVTSWGGEGSLPLAEATQIDTSNPAPAPNGASASGASAGLTASDLVFPIQGVDWTMSYIEAHKVIENSPLVYTTFTPLDTTSGADKTISVSDLQLNPFWNSVVDANLTFHTDRLTDAEITFKEPPPIDDLVAKFSALRGDPTEKKLEAQYGTTRIFWKGNATLPDLTVTESQGILKMLYHTPGATPDHG